MNARTSKHLSMALLMLLGFHPFAAAQEPNPLEEPNPLDAPKPREQEPEWVGAFGNEQAHLKLVLYLSTSASGSFEGTMVVGEAQQIYIVEARGDAGRLEGTFGKAAQQRFPFTMSRESADVLVMNSGNSTHRLTRDATAPRTSVELRAGGNQVSGPREQAGVPAVGGIVVLKNGEVFVGRVAEEGSDLVIRWPYKDKTQPGEMSVPKSRVRWYSRETDELNDAYWSHHENDEIDSAWLPSLERWRRARGSPSTSPPPPSAPRTVDLSHLQRGQKYTYALQGGIQMVWTITDITGTTVRYMSQTLMDQGQGLRPIGDPTRAEVRHDTADNAPAVVPAGTTMTREKLRAAGIEFDCMVVTSGDTKSYTSVQGDLPVFPMIVKSLLGRQTVMELIRVEPMPRSPAPASAPALTPAVSSGQVEEGKRIFREAERAIDQGKLQEAASLIDQAIACEPFPAFLATREFVRAALAQREGWGALTGPLEDVLVAFGNTPNAQRAVMAEAMRFLERNLQTSTIAPSSGIEATQQGDVQDRIEALITIQGLDVKQVRETAQGMSVRVELRALVETTKKIVGVLAFIKCQVVVPLDLTVRVTLSSWAEPSGGRRRVAVCSMTAAPLDPALIQVSRHPDGDSELASWAAQHAGWVKGTFILGEGLGRIPGLGLNRKVGRGWTLFWEAGRGTCFVDQASRCRCCGDSRTCHPTRPCDAQCAFPGPAYEARDIDREEFQGKFFLQQEALLSGAVLGPYIFPVYGSRVRFTHRFTVGQLPMIGIDKDLLVAARGSSSTSGQGAPTVLSRTTRIVLDASSESRHEVEVTLLGPGDTAVTSQTIKAGAPLHWEGNVPPGAYGLRFVNHGSVIIQATQGGRPEVTYKIVDPTVGQAQASDFQGVWRFEGPRHPSNGKPFLIEFSFHQDRVGVRQVMGDQEVARTTVPWSLPDSNTLRIGTEKDRVDWGYRLVGNYLRLVVPDGRFTLTRVR